MSQLNRANWRDVFGGVARYLRYNSETASMVETNMYCTIYILLVVDLRSTTVYAVLIQHIQHKIQRPRILGNTGTQYRRNSYMYSNTGRLAYLF